MPQNQTTNIAGMASQSPASAAFQKTLTKMPYSDQLDVLRLKATMTAHAETLLYTSLLQRKFIKNFYRWSIRLAEIERALAAEAGLAQSRFLQSLGVLRESTESQGYGAWCGIEPKPQPKELVVLLFHPSGSRLQRTFVAADRFLAPVYAAFLVQKISYAEFDDIKAKVKVEFKTLANVMDELLTHSKNR